MSDTFGRPYLTFDEACRGLRVELDGGFTCARKGARKTLRGRGDRLYFHCDCGHHFLDGQADFDGGKFYVGVYREV